MNDKLNIPQSIQNYGAGGVKAETSIIDETEFLDKLPEVAANAIADACTGSNPRILAGRNGTAAEGLLLRSGSGFLRKHCKQPDRRYILEHLVPNPI